MHVLSGSKPFHRWTHGICIQTAKFWNPVSKSIMKAGVDICVWMPVVHANIFGRVYSRDSLSVNICSNWIWDASWMACYSSTACIVWLFRQMNLSASFHRKSLTRTKQVKCGQYYINWRKLCSPSCWPCGKLYLIRRLLMSSQCGDILLTGSAWSKIVRLRLTAKIHDAILIEIIILLQVMSTTDISKPSILGQTQASSGFLVLAVTLYPKVMICCLVWTDGNDLSLLSSLANKKGTQSSTFLHS